jgi:hypothetical protein
LNKLNIEIMSTKEKMPIPEEIINPIPETKDQGKTKSDRVHIDPLEKKAFDTPNTGGRSGK